MVEAGPAARLLLGGLAMFPAAAIVGTGAEVGDLQGAACVETIVGAPAAHGGARELSAEAR